MFKGKNIIIGRRSYEKLLLDSSQVVELIVESIKQQLILEGGSSMSDTALQEELKKVRKMIAGVAPVEANFGFSNGEHQAIPKSMTIEKSGKNHDGSLQVTIEWEGVSETIKGKSHRDYNNLSSEMGIGLMKGKGHVLGLDLNAGEGRDILNWQNMFNKFVEENTSVFNIKVSQKDENSLKNVYVLGVVEEGNDLGTGDGLDNSAGIDDLSGLGEGDDLGELEQPKPTAKPTAKPTTRTAGKR